MLPYTQDNFQEWIFYIDNKMDSFTEKFADENNLELNYSIQSLDDLENWIINKFEKPIDLKNNSKLLDLITIYIGETFRKYIGGKWYMELENKKNIYYHIPVLTDDKFKGVIYKSPTFYSTACMELLLLSGQIKRISLEF